MFGGFVNDFMNGATFGGFLNFVRQFSDQLEVSKNLALMSSFPQKIGLLPCRLAVLYASGFIVIFPILL